MFIVKYLVIQSAAYFPSQCALNSRPVMSAMISALQSHGITMCECSMDADAAIIWSVLWHGRMRPNLDIYEHYRAQAKPVIIVDVGALLRNHTWKIAVNHINSLGYYGHQIDLDSDRPKKLGLRLQTPTANNPAILIAAQHRHSLQLLNIDQYQWINDTVAQIQQHSDRPVVVRSHPRSPLQRSKLPPNIIIDQPRRLQGTYDSFDIDYSYHTVINYNSGPGTQAAIAGAQVITHESSLAHPVSTNIAHIEDNISTDREQWFLEICHTEYTVEEIEQGLWIKRLQAAL
jgi:hypothetical protein